MSTAGIAVVTLVVAAITYAARAAPFAFLRGRTRHPLLTFLSRAMPLGVMVVLVGYTLDGLHAAPSTWVPPTLGILATAVLHRRWRQVALSLVGGTGVYVVLSLLLT